MDIRDLTGLILILYTGWAIPGYSAEEVKLSCPHGWSTVDASCLRVFSLHAVRGWELAQLTCQSFGANLVRVVDYEMTQAVGDMVQQEAGTDKFWIGMRRSLNQTAWWSDGTQTSVLRGFWRTEHPDLEAGYCVYLSKPSTIYQWAFGLCEVPMPFVCERTACPAESFHCARDQCVVMDWVCDGVDDCGDFSDEMDCSSRCTFHQTGKSSSIELSSNPSKLCSWLIQGPVGSNIRLQINSLKTEKNLGEVRVYAGGMSEITSHLVKTFTGELSAPYPMVWSPNNLMLVKYQNGGQVSSPQFTAQWEAVSIVPDKMASLRVDLTAILAPKTFASPFYGDWFYLGMQQVVWVITATMMRQLVTLQVDDMDLGNGDTVIIRDGRDASAPLLTSYPRVNHPMYVTSTGSSLYVMLTTRYHRPQRGFRFSYKQGCDVKLTSDTGAVVSPGYGVMKYPNFQTCTFRIEAEKTVTLLIHNFSVETRDRLQVYEGSNSSGSLLYNSFADYRPTSSDNFFLEFKTNALLNDDGFMALYSIDCPEIWFNGDTIMRPDHNSSYGSKFTVSCKTGYYFAAEVYEDKTGGSSTFKSVAEVDMECLYGGVWNVKVLPECKLVYCGAPPFLDHGFVMSSTSVLYRGTVTYGCTDGFNLVPSENITCQADGEWSDVPNCHVTSCQNQMDPRDGSILVERGSGTSYTSMLRYRCDVGYQIIGPEILFCQSNTSWSNSPPICTRLQCGIPETIPNGNINASASELFYGDTISVTCDPGYELIGDRELKCNDNQTFGTLPNCTDLNECGSPGSNNCGRVAVCKNLPGSYVCECPHGYQLNNDSMTCSDINECADVSNCEDTCNNTDGGYGCGCRTGYRLYTANGTEGYTIPMSETGLRPGDVYRIDHTCVRVQCPEPRNVTNGELLSDHMTYHYEDTVDYMCRLGYVMTAGATVLRCMENKMWSADPPTCNRAMCQAEVIPSSVMNVPIIPSTRPVYYGDAITLTCTIPGLDRPVVKQRMCVYNRTSRDYHFSGADYECGYIDCGIPEHVAGSLDYRSGLDNTTYGQSFLFECVTPVFVKSGSSTKGDSTVRCDSRGRWGFNTLQCQGGTCDDPGRPPDGQQIATTYKQGAEVTFSCDRDGFALSDATPLKCDIYRTGANLEWDRPVPSCVDKENPVFVNCPSVAPIRQFIAPGFPVPEVDDNSGSVADFSVDPAWFLPSLELTADLNVTYTAVDHAGNTKTCFIPLIVIASKKPEITCPVSYVEFLWQSIQPVRPDPNKVIYSGTEVRLTLTPSMYDIQPSDVGTYSNVTAEATDKHGASVSCMFQIVVNDAPCTPNAVPTPLNGKKDCGPRTGQSSLRCTLTCDLGFTFYQDGLRGQFVTECDGIANSSTASWSNTDFPQCVRSTDRAERREAFEFEYSANEIVSQSCVDGYNQSLPQFMLTDLAAVETGKCTEYVKLTLVVSSVENELTVYANGTKVYVKFAFAITPNSSGEDILDLCAKYLNLVYGVEGVGITPSYISNLLTFTDTVGSCSSLNATSRRRISSSYVCPPDQKWRNESGSIVCLKCPPGTFKLASGECAPCAQGMYQPEEGQLNCLDCPSSTQYTYTQGSSSLSDCVERCPIGWMSMTGLPPCVECPRNHYWYNSTMCSPCPNDTGTPMTGAKSQTDCSDVCPKGMYSLTGLRPCTACPVGFYQNNMGEDICLECRDGYTNNTGTTSPDNCISVRMLCNVDRCENEGLCRVSSHSYYCECPTGYTGRHCEMEVDTCMSSPCHYNSTCVSALNSFTCTCPSPRESEPVFTNCPTDPITIWMYRAPNVPVPEAMEDKTTVPTLVKPTGFNLTRPLIANTTVIYTAINMAGLEEVCQVHIVVKAPVVPRLNCIPSYVQYISTDRDNYRIRTMDGATVDPSVVYTNGRTYFIQIVQANVTGDDGYQDQCKFQVEFRAQLTTVCSLEYLSTHTTGAMNCQSIAGGELTCSLSCSQSEHVIYPNNIKCNIREQNWSVSPFPQCVKAVLASNVAPTDTYNVTYVATDTIPERCVENYRQVVTSQLTSVPQMLQQTCERQNYPNVQVNIYPENVQYSVNGNKLTLEFLARFSSVSAANLTACRRIVKNNLEQTLTQEYLDNITSPDCPFLRVDSIQRTLTGDKCPRGLEMHEEYCLPCPPGMYKVGWDCLPCQQGWYNEESDKADCKPCGEGLTTRTTGTVFRNQCLEECEGGFYSNTGLPLCQSCNRGFYRVNSTGCAPCPQGQSTLNSGAMAISSCQGLCPAGHYSAWGLVPCEACPPNYYQRATGKTTCEECPDSTTTTEYGADSLAKCVTVVSKLCGINPCRNGGRCESDGKHSYICTCQPAFSGKLCQWEVPYRGATCEIERSNCYLGLCQNGGMCQDLDQDFNCLCAAGFLGRHCEIATPLCDQRPCENGATCEELGGVRRQCHCPTGFTGEDCGARIDYCSSSPCLYGGECGNEVDGYTCDCLAGYHGDMCETRSSPCDGNTEQNGRCVDDYTSDKALLVCKPGYLVPTGTGQMSRCVDVDGCDSDPCGSTGTCNQTALGAYHCMCNHGYMGSLCQHDQDDCSPDPCRNGATCEDRLGRYSCHCPPGFTGDHCETDINACLDTVCDPVGTRARGCQDLPNGYQCQCNMGYMGHNCSVDMNECASYPCNHGGICTDLVNAYRCDCPPGWAGPRCEKLKSYCDNNTCQNSGQCIDIFGGFVCNCPVDRYGSLCELSQAICDRVQPCMNQGVCEETTSTALCTCNTHQATVCDYVRTGMPDTGNDDDVTTRSLCEKQCSEDATCLGFTIESGNCTVHSSLANMGHTGFYRKGNCNDLQFKYSGRGCELLEDSCEGSMCQHGGTCVTAPSGGVMCKCAPGYTGTGCETQVDNCAGNPCLGSSTCLNGVDQYFCRCPLGMMGPICDQAVNVNFDLYFYSPTKTGQASLPYPINLASDSFSISLWVRYRVPQSNGTVFMMFGVKKANSLDEKKERMRIDEGGVTLNLPGFPSVQLLKYTDFRVNDGKWHYILLTWDDVDRHVNLRVNGVNQDAKIVPQIPLRLPPYVHVWITLGNLYNPLLEQPTSDGGFIGYISQLNMYRRTIDLDAEAHLLADNSSTVLEGTALRWWEYRLHGGVQRIWGSTVGMLELETVKPVPVFTHCPDDISKFGPTRTTAVGWTDPLAPGANKFNNNYRSGQSFLWGRYQVIYQAWNERGGTALCSFRVYVKNGDCDTLGPDEGSVDVTAIDHFKSYTLKCNNDNYRVSSRTPVYYTCGPSGNFDPSVPARYIPYRFPPCGAVYSPPIPYLSLVLKYSINGLCNDDAEARALATKIKEHLSSLFVTWGVTLCDDCVTDEVRCDSSTSTGRKRRAVGDTSTLTAEIRINNVSLSLTNPVTMEKLNPDQIITMDILENEGFTFADLIGGIEIDKDGYVVQVSDQCPEGQVAIQKNCVSCGRGTYRNTTLTECVPCPIGQYQHNLGTESCILCPAGETTRTYGTPYISHCREDCRVGYRYTNRSGVDTCVQCPVGFYQPRTGQFVCLPCSVGTTTQSTGSTTADQCFVECPAGQNHSAAGDCVDCSKGFYRPENTSSFCLRCPPGKTTPSGGAVSENDCSEVDCHAGYKIVGMTCVPCPKGTYQPVAYQTECKNCTEGKSTQTTAASSSDQCESYCISGQTKVGGVCTPCARGTYKDNSDGVFAGCVNCPPDFITDGDGGAALADCSVTACDPGNYLSNGVCRRCAIGYYQPDKWQDSCIKCLDPTNATAQTGSILASDCVALCNPGQVFMEGKCTVCPRGSYSSGSISSICQPCNLGFTTAGDGATDMAACRQAACVPGEFRNTTNHCQKCAVGKYQPIKWQESCLTCPGDLTTSGTGSDKLGNCVDVCDTVNYCKNGGVCQKGSIPVCRCLQQYKGDTCEIRKAAEDIAQNQTEVILGTVIGVIVFLIIIILIITAVCIYTRRKSVIKEKLRGETSSIIGATRLVTDPFYTSRNSMAGSIELNRSFLRLGEFEENMGYDMMGFENSVYPRGIIGDDDGSYSLVIS